MSGSEFFCNNIKNNCSVNGFNYFYTKSILQMLTNIDIDDRKVKEIMTIMNIKTKKEAVNIAIDEYLRALSAKELLKLKGSNAWEGNLDEMWRD